MYTRGSTEEQVKQRKESVNWEKDQSNSSNQRSKGEQTEKKKKKGKQWRQINEFTGQNHTLTFASRTPEGKEKENRTETLFGKNIAKNFFNLEKNVEVQIQEAGSLNKSILSDPWAYLAAQLVKNPPAIWEAWIQSWVGKRSISKHI